MLFSESTLRKLNQLTLVASRVRAGAVKGGRRSSRRGSSVEFADYRNYAPGDDLRRLDWNIYARLERPFIKLFEEEEDLAVYILLDGSRSMDWGDGDLHKFRYAQRLAAGLGAIALASGDSLSVGFLQNGRVSAEFGSTRGQAALPRLFSFLENLQPGGITNLDASLQHYALKPRRPGLVILISDLLDAGGYQAGLRPMQGRGHDAALVHVLSPDELDPPFSGDLQLVDIESGQTQDISLDGGLLTLYRERAQAWLHETQAECRRQSVRYLGLTTREPWDQALLLEMRRAGIVK
ncbi:MAG: DUF58 domain-containing protein [Chloroflexi bacterium]|nr:DUF58 domain-containing protein [Chloroflexota bacterium]MDL1940863.1 DUF58 domain-containing protein [Chloroflexi bacterium CFX2]